MENVIHVKPVVKPKWWNHGWNFTAHNVTALYDLLLYRLRDSPYVTFFPFRITVFILFWTVNVTSSQHLIPLYLVDWNEESVAMLRKVNQSQVSNIVYFRRQGKLFTSKDVQWMFYD